MSSTSTTLFFSFYTVLLLFTFLCFTPYSPISSSLFSKALSFLQVNPSDDAVDSNFITSYDSVGHAVISDPLEVSEAVPAVDEKDVVVLTRHNFTEFIASNPYVMVNFYAPWCYWSQKLEPEYSAAATMLKNTEAVLAKVDCSVENELGRKYKIQGYPSMFLFIRGAKKVAYDPSDARSRDAIASWMKLKMSPHVRTVETEEKAQDILSAKSKLVFGFLNSLEDAVSEELADVPKLHDDIEFYQTTNLDTARLFGVDEEITRPALFFLQREPGMNHTLFRFDGEFTGSAISEFVSVYKLPSVITFKVEEAPLVFNNPMKQLWLFTPKLSRGATCTFKEAAMAFKGKLLFVHVETGCGDVGRLLSYQFGVTEDASRVVAYTPTGNSKKHIYTGELTLHGITSFANQFLEDKLMDQQDLKSDTLLKLPTQSYTADPIIGSYVN